MQASVASRSPGQGPRRAALTLAAVVGVVVGFTVLASLTFGVKALVFQSGSMSPTIETGALALAHSVPAADIRLGDVIGVEDAGGSRITHRVVGIDFSSGDAREVRLRGDANQQADLEPYAITSAERIFFHVNGLGYVLVWLSNPFVAAAGILGVALALSTTFGSSNRRRNALLDSRSRDKVSGFEPTNPVQGSAKILRRSPLVLALVLLTAVGTADVSGTSAALTAAAAAKSGAFGSKAAFVPAINTPVIGGGGNFVNCESDSFYVVRVSWAHLGDPYTYKVALRTDTVPPEIYTTFNVTPPAGTAAGATVSTTYGAFPVTSFGDLNYNFEIHTVLPSSGAVSSAWRGTIIHRPGLGTRARCGRWTSTGKVVDVSGDNPVPANSPAMAGAQRHSLDPEQTSEVAPTTPPDAVSTTDQPSTTQPTTDEPTTTAPAAPGETSTTSPDPTAPTVPPIAPAPTEEPLTSPVGSSSGNYMAQVVQSETGPSAVIRNGDTEVYRTSVSAEDTVGWVPGTDVLQIVTESGTWTVSNSSGVWVKTAVVPTPAAPPVPAPGQTPTVEQVPEERAPSTESGPA
ncbi:signal peptidase I [Rhodococcus sp. 1168]|uniref:signal peptidase I n=1 Tax=Rhodococcus sp. 1168 TaxID=2018041 RepID=UPI0015936E2D|nr:signal peptidase I [Rhodococcus sp. 1168]